LHIEIVFKQRRRWQRDKTELHVWRVFLICTADAAR
jgi:hypothetical protein